MENPLKNSPILVKGLDECISLILYILSDFDTFVTTYAHQSVVSYCEFHANRRGEIRTLLGDVN